MATMITSECINCGACEPECPNTAIYQGGVTWEFGGASHPALAADIFYIVPEKCTECVGFHDKEACAAVCPVDCCLPDPGRVESEAVLMARTRELHPDKTFPEEFPSRFKGADGNDASPAAEPSAATAPAAPAAQAATAPAVATAPTTAAETTTPEGWQPIPELETWEIPLDCHRCHGSFAVEFRHFRSGVVLRCPFCNGSYVVSTAMHNQLARPLREFHAQWSREFETFQDHRRRELEDFEERQRGRLESFTHALRQMSLGFRPSGAARKRAGIFG